MEIFCKIISYEYVSPCIKTMVVNYRYDSNFSYEIGIPQSCNLGCLCMYTTEVYIPIFISSILDELACNYIKYMIAKKNCDMKLTDVLAPNLFINPLWLEYML